MNSEEKSFILIPRNTLDGWILFFQFVGWCSFYFYWLQLFVRVKEPEPRILYGVAVGFGMSLILEGVGKVWKMEGGGVGTWAEKMFIATLLADFTLLGGLVWSVWVKGLKDVYGIVIVMWTVASFVLFYLHQLRCLKIKHKEGQEKPDNIKS